ncbi:MAG: hypothetical protein II843_01275 [Alphaproteobacteria bacterium]|nr:hypothetical protein [Alphaproteobacteria bacterium]
MEQIIVKYLMTHRNGLTVKECQERFGTTELRKFISRLKEHGYKFHDVWEYGINRYGLNTRFKRYWLISTPKNK